MKSHAYMTLGSVVWQVKLHQQCSFAVNSKDFAQLDEAKGLKMVYTPKMVITRGKMMMNYGLWGVVLDKNQIAVGP